MLKDVKAGEYSGLPARWGKPSKDRVILPPGKYFQYGPTFIVALKLSGNKYSESSKHTYQMVCQERGEE